MKSVMKEQYKVEKNIIKTEKGCSSEKNIKTRKKRKELSISATRTVTKHNVKVKVRFD